MCDLFATRYCKRTQQKDSNRKQVTFDSEKTKEVSRVECPSLNCRCDLGDDRAKAQQGKEYFGNNKDMLFCHMHIIPTKSCIGYNETTMANDNKTSATDKDVFDFLGEWVENEQKREDSLALIELMQKITGHPPKMWGPTMVGFGDWHYVSPSGREGDWFSMGFSPRKAAISLYITMDATAYPDLMKKLGKHTTGKGCIYVKKLSDIDMGVLEELARTSYKDLSKQYTVR